MRTIPTAPSLSGAPAADPAAERRGLERKTVLIPAIAVCPDGMEYRCVLRDVSTTGARIAIPSRHRLPSRFGLATGSRPNGFPMRLAWQRGDSRRVDPGTGRGRADANRGLNAQG